MKKIIKVAGIVAALAAVMMIETGCSGVGKVVGRELIDFAGAVRSEIRSEVYIDLTVPGVAARYLIEEKDLHKWAPQVKESALKAYMKDKLANRAEGDETYIDSQRWTKVANGHSKEKKAARRAALDAAIDKDREVNKANQAQEEAQVANSVKNIFTSLTSTPEMLCKTAIVAAAATATIIALSVGIHEYSQNSRSNLIVE
jgi:hypothetical protein